MNGFLFNSFSYIERQSSVRHFLARWKAATCNPRTFWNTFSLASLGHSGRAARAADEIMIGSSST